MALLQTDHQNAIHLMGSPQSPARLATQGFAQLGEFFFAPIRTALQGLQQWSTRRALRKWRMAVERARQRRVLAQLSDRELRDIGITRYEVDFVLRQNPWR